MVVKVKVLMPDGEMMLVTRGMTTVETRWSALCRYIMPECKSLIGGNRKGRGENESMLIGCLPRENSTLDHGLGSGHELGSWGDHTSIPVGFVEQTASNFGMSKSQGLRTYRSPSRVWVLTNSLIWC